MVGGAALGHILYHRRHITLAVNSIIPWSIFQCLERTCGHHDSRFHVWWKRPCQSLLGRRWRQMTLSWVASVCITVNRRSFPQYFVVPRCRWLGVYPASWKFENIQFCRKKLQEWPVLCDVVMRARLVVKATKLHAEVVGMAVGGLLACTADVCWAGVKVTAKFESSQWLSWYLLSTCVEISDAVDFRQLDLVYPVQVWPRSEYVVGNADPCIVSFPWHKV